MRPLKGQGIVAVVGNGPTAERHGAEIDAADFVVRVTDCRLMGAGGAGARIDALAWYCCRGEPLHAPPGDYEHWITLPPSRCWPPNELHMGGWLRIVDQAAARNPLAWITDYQWQKEELAIGRPPTTGLTAVHMALLQLEPARLVLAGFDATTPDRPGFDNRPGSENHDFQAEKRLLAGLRDHRTFLGQEWDCCEVEWIDPPDLDPAAVRKAAGLD